MCCIVVYKFQVQPNRTTSNKVLRGCPVKSYKMSAKTELTKPWYDIMVKRDKFEHFLQSQGLLGFHRGKGKCPKCELGNVSFARGQVTERGRQKFSAVDGQRTAPISCHADMDGVFSGSHLSLTDIFILITLGFRSCCRNSCDMNWRYLTHWGRVMHICVTELSHIWFR